MPAIELIDVAKFPKKSCQKVDLHRELRSGIKRQLITLKMNGFWAK